jgi:coenzyme F420-reducing hydrogenase delta subunit
MKDSLEALKEALKERGVNPDELDLTEEVYDWVSAKDEDKIAEINNGGIDSQMAFFLTEFGGSVDATANFLENF